MTAVLMVIILTGRVAACDFCLRLPRVPFEFDHPASIEVALATQAAAKRGHLDLNPVVKLTGLSGNSQTVPLSEISPRQLVTEWVRMRPAASARSLRCTLELCFVDVDYVGLLDIRFGEVLEGDRSHGPADIRLMTTKAGFCRLLEVGLAVCEQQQLAAIEVTEGVDVHDIHRLFASEATPKVAAPRSTSFPWTAALQ